MFGELASVGGGVLPLHASDPLILLALTMGTLAAGQRRLAEAEARRTLHIWATDPAAVESAERPEDVLLEELGRTVSVVRKLQERILQEDPNALVWGVALAEAGTVPDGHGGVVEVATVRKQAKPSVWLTLYGEERKRLLEICRVVVSAGLEEQRVRLEASHVALIGDAIRAGLTAILPPELQREALAAASRYLVTIDARAGS